MSSNRRIVWEEELQAILFALVGGARYGLKIRLPHALVMTGLFRGDLNVPQKLKLVLQLVKEHAKNLAIFAALYKIILFLLKLLSRFYCGSEATATKSTSSVQQSGLLQRCRRILISLLVGKRAPFTTDSQCHTTPRPPVSVAGYPQFPHHAMIAGLIGGYCVWGNYSSINYQIVLYLTSRVFIGVVQRLMRHPAGAERALSSSAKTICSVPQFVRDRTYSLCTAMIWAMVMFLFEDSPEVLHPSLKNSMDEIYRFRPWSSLLPDSSP